MVTVDVVVCRTLETLIHNVEENAQDLQELQSQVSLKHSAMMTERELAADARDQTLKCKSPTVRRQKTLDWMIGKESGNTHGHLKERAQWR